MLKPSAVIDAARLLQQMQPSNLSLMATPSASLRQQPQTPIKDQCGNSRSNSHLTRETSSRRSRHDNHAATSSRSTNRSQVPAARKILTSSTNEIQKRDNANMASSTAGLSHYRNRNGKTENLKPRQLLTSTQMEDNDVSFQQQTASNIRSFPDESSRRQYLARRAKNNEAARRSRDKKKQEEIFMRHLLDQCYDRLVKLRSAAMFWCKAYNALAKCQPSLPAAVPPVDELKRWSSVIENAAVHDIPQGASDIEVPITNADVLINLRNSLPEFHKLLQELGYSSCMEELACSVTNDDNVADDSHNRLSPKELHPSHVASATTPRKGVRSTAAESPRSGGPHQKRTACEGSIDDYREVDSRTMSPVYGPLDGTSTPVMDSEMGLFSDQDKQNDQDIPNCMTPSVTEVMPSSVMSAAKNDSGIDVLENSTIYNRQSVCLATDNDGSLTNSPQNSLQQTDEPMAVKTPNGAYQEEERNVAVYSQQRDVETTTNQQSMVQEPYNWWQQQQQQQIMSDEEDKVTRSNGDPWRTLQWVESHPARNFTASKCAYPFSGNANSSIGGNPPLYYNGCNNMGFENRQQEPPRFSCQKSSDLICDDSDAEKLGDWPNEQQRRAGEYYAADSGATSDLLQTCSADPPLYYPTNELCAGGNACYSMNGAVPVARSRYTSEASDLNDTDRDGSRANFMQPIHHSAYVAAIAASLQQQQQQYIDSMAPPPAHGGLSATAPLRNSLYFPSHGMAGNPSPTVNRNQAEFYNLQQQDYQQLQQRQLPAVDSFFYNDQKI